MTTLAKFNPHHDAQGRFTSAEGAGKPSLGTCYRDAYYAVDSGGTKAVRYDGYQNVKLVHGEVNIINPITEEKGRGGHGWVEFDQPLDIPKDAFPGMNIGPQSITMVHDVGGSGKVYPQVLFYKAAKVENTTSYTQNEMHAQALKHEHFGPWGGQARFIDASGKRTLYGKADRVSVLKFSHCSVQAPAPQLDSSFIADEDLAGKGRSESHVIVKHGVSHAPEQLAEVLASCQPFTVTLGSVFAFDPTENSDWTAPVVVEVKAPELQQLHDTVGAAIGVKPDTFDYAPHLTLAYVKPEEATKYEGRDDFEGVTFVVSALELMDLDGNVTEVPLGGGVLKVRKAKDPEEENFFNDLDDLMKQEWLSLPAQVRQDLLESFTAGVDKGISDLGVKDSTLIGKVNTVAQGWAADRAAELVGMKYDTDGQLIENPDARMAISDTTRDKLRDIVTNAFANETKLQDLEADIKEAGAFSDSRAKMIAKHEASQAMISGNYETWGQSGVVLKLRWLLSDDHDVEDECDLNDGAVVNFGEPFPSGDLMPTLHPGCECGVVAAEIEGISL